MYPPQRKPTRGLEPRTPSLRVAPSSPFLALARHFRAQNMSRDHLRFAEFGTYLGTRPQRRLGLKRADAQRIRIPKMSLTCRESQ
jgi:hypothetical protein